MGAPAFNGQFMMPMFRSFVPRIIQPWIYVFIILTFQISGVVYLGALDQMIGDRSLMREDLLMCLYMNLAGMAIYFPMLFRMKFRFTNKTLLTAAASGALICNLAGPHIEFLPLLWVVCFIEGICKIQGTFECVSNIQLWLTPKRDFTVFFPALNMVILLSIQLSTIITVLLTYHMHWTYMNLFVAGLMLIDLTILLTCIRHFHFMKKRLPLFGIDWLGAALWAALLAQVAYLFDYGDWYDWWNCPVVKELTVSIILTLVFAVWRMLTIRHPYLEPAIWRYRHVLPLLGMVTFAEAVLATEYVLEKVFYSEVMGYSELVQMRLDWITVVGILAGCLFAYLWMHVMRGNFLRLITTGLAVLAVYLIVMYFSISSDIHISQLYLPVALRGFAYAVLSSTFMATLQELMTFQHFFQGLSVFNMLHMVVGGVIGAAVYARGLAYYVPDNLARYGSAIDHVAYSESPFNLGGFMDGFIVRIMEVSIKQIYGWATYACILVVLLLMFYDAPVRHTLKKMPSWLKVAKDVKNSFWRTTHGKTQ